MKDWSDEKLLDSTHALMDEERRITLEVIRHLAEVRRRRLYAKRGFASMGDFLTGELRLSEPSAQQRLQIMRLLDKCPSLTGPLENGKLSMSIAADLERVSRHLKKDPQQLVPLVSGKPYREGKRILNELLPGRAYREGMRDLPGGVSEIRIIVTQEEKSMVTKLRDLQSHKLLSLSELFVGLVKSALVETDPMTRNSLRTSEVTNPYSAHIPKHFRTEVWKRDGGACTYTDPITGRRCASTAYLQVDHIEPRALGGKNELANLRLLCLEHNLLVAAERFGTDFLESFRH